MVNDWRGSIWKRKEKIWKMLRDKRSKRKQKERDEEEREAQKLEEEQAHLEVDFLRQEWIKVEK